MAITDNRQNTRGKGIITEAYMYSALSGVRVPILKYMMNIDIYEDIYHPYVYCDMVIADHDGFAKQFPLAGEEYFVFSWQSIGGKTCSYHFLIHKMDNLAITDTNSTTGYVLSGVTLERAFDTAKTVSSAYRGSYSKIAGQIFDDWVAVDTGGLSLNFEPSRSVEYYIPPQITPFEAIEYCRARAVSVSEVRSPFLFFRNSDGYYFQSFNGLFNVAASADLAQITHRYSAAGANPESSEEEQPNTNADIVDYEVTSYYDTLDKIDSGAYNIHTFSFDLTTKWFGIRQQYNLTDYKDKFQLGGAGAYNRASFLKAFDNTRCVAMYYPTDCSRELIGTTKDTLPMYAGEMSAYMNLVAEYNLNFTTYGDSNVTAGQVMKVLIPQGRDVKDTESARTGVSDMLSGSFLLTHVRHSLTIGENVEYYNVISGVNGARSVNIEKVK